MKKLKISDFWIYKFRYQIGIGILSLGYLAIIIYTLFITPNGLTAGEIENTKSAVNLDFSNIFSKNIIDLPYRLLQKISIDIFHNKNIRNVVFETCLYFSFYYCNYIKPVFLYCSKRNERNSLYFLPNFANLERNGISKRAKKTPNFHFSFDFRT